MRARPVRFGSICSFPRMKGGSVCLLRRRRVRSLTGGVPKMREVHFFVAFKRDCLARVGYLRGMKVLSATPIRFGKRRVIPVRFLGTLLPSPTSLNPEAINGAGVNYVFANIGSKGRGDVCVCGMYSRRRYCGRIRSRTVSCAANIPTVVNSVVMIAKR